MQRQTLSLSTVSFLTGFSLMAYELVAARLLAPTIGSSTYVWTSVVGVIIAALSLGYWLGGKLADTRQKHMDVVVLCLVAASCVVATMLTHESILASISTSITDARIQGVLASLLLFSPTSFFLGCISPYLAKLNIKTLQTAGESVANLSAFNSIGGITGTFITGFVLFAYLGSNEALSIVVVCLIVSSWLLTPRKFIAQRIAASLILLALLFLPGTVPVSSVARIDTPSAHYEISRLNFNGEAIYGLSTGPGGIQSAVYEDGRDDLVFWYTNYAKDVIEKISPSNILILGGGAFTLPTALANDLPNAAIDVVEIDPALESISKEYFNYQDHPNINLYFNDARAFVNTSQTKYDAVFVDVYGDSYVPFSLLTQEYGKQIQSMLNPNGVVVINAIVGLQGQCKGLLDAIDAVYRPFLPNAFWQTQPGYEITRGNYILLYTKASTPPVPMHQLPASTSSKLYTDNFMPAEQLHYECEQAAN